MKHEEWIVFWVWSSAHKVTELQNLCIVQYHLSDETMTLTPSPIQWYLRNNNTFLLPFSQTRANWNTHLSLYLTNFQPSKKVECNKQTCTQRKKPSPSHHPLDNILKAQKERIKSNRTYFPWNLTTHTHTHTHTHTQTKTKKLHKVLHTSDFQHNLRSTETTDRGQDRRVHERTEDGGRTDDSPSGRLSEKLSNIVKIGLLSGSFSPSEQWVLGHGSTSYAHILHLVLYRRSNELPHALSNQHKRS